MFSDSDWAGSKVDRKSVSGGCIVLGNTWVRSMVASLLYTGDGFFNFQILDNIPQFPDNKYFKDFTNDLEKNIYLNNI